MRLFLIALTALLLTGAPAFAQWDGAPGSRPHASNSYQARGFHQIDRYVTVAGDTTHTFQVPGRFTDVELVVIGRGTTAATNQSFSITVNGSSSAIYSQQRIFATGNGPSTNNDTVIGGTKLTQTISCSGASAYASQACYLRIRFFNINDPTFYKQAEWTGRQPNSNSNATSFTITGIAQFDTLAPISTIAVTIDANAWVAGSTFTLNALN